MTPYILGFSIGLVLRSLVPMPWLDEPVRKGWAWLWAKIT